MEPILTDAIAFVTKLFAENAGGHDAGHTLRVWQNAQKLAAAEPDCDAELVSLAALLHDADDHKLFHTENNANARGFLEAHGVESARIERICEAINSVSFSKNRGRRPKTLEGKLVQDADRLDAIGAIGVARAFAFGGEHGRSMSDTVEHFYEKLLLLKDEMNTEAGRALAEERHAFLEQFLEQFYKELRV